jgi:hypothetical protein
MKEPGQVLRSVVPALQDLSIDEFGATQLFFCKFKRGGKVGQAARN